MHRSLLCALAISIAIAVASAAYGKQLYSLVRVDLSAHADLEKFRALYLDVTWIEDSYADVVIEADRLSILDDAGLDYAVQIADMSAFYRSRLAEREGGVGSMGGFRTIRIDRRKRASPGSPEIIAFPR